MTNQTTQNRTTLIHFPFPTRQKLSVSHFRVTEITIQVIFLDRTLRTYGTGDTEVSSAHSTHSNVSGVT